MATIIRDAPHHNTLTCVKDYGCLLPGCRDRYKAYQRNRYHARVAGTWQPLVDAEPIRQHILTLHAAGITDVRISELANLPFATVAGFTRIHGTTNNRRARKRRCTTEVAAKVLAITTDEATPTCVDATGTRRRIQALVAAGWPMVHLAPHFGLAVRTVIALINQERIYARNAKVVAEAYLRLTAMRPDRNGVSRRSVTRARNLAANRRWANKTYWADRMDVIDDPHFTPEYGLTRAELLAEEARWLIETGGLTRTQAAERLHKDRSYIDRVLGADYEAAA